MPVVGHGIDLVDARRIARLLREHPERFPARVLTPAERQIARRQRDPVPFVAGRWAAKEAILKALGTGWRGRIAWTDMEILPDPLGRPNVALRGATAERARELGVARILLSITHTAGHAAASALALGD